MAIFKTKYLMSYISFNYSTLLTHNMFSAQYNRNYYSVSVLSKRKCRNYFRLHSMYETDG
jgi:hypothetical protein